MWGNLICKVKMGGLGLSPRDPNSYWHPYVRTDTKNQNDRISLLLDSKLRKTFPTPKSSSLDKKVDFEIFKIDKKS